jgi:N6-adenosine-specific RNA methylase IME4
LKLYRTIVADPPWRYIGQSTSRATAPYDTMTLGELVALPVMDYVDDDCHLWLWTTNAFMEDAHRLQRAWGFKPVTIVTWCKPGPGVGYYVRNNTEHLLLGSRGRPAVPEHKPLASWYQWPRAAHSEKPAHAYDLIEQVSQPPFLELFARSQRLGWESWGNEALCHIDLAERMETPAGGGSASANLPMNPCLR